MPSEEVLAKGLIERLGSKDSRIDYQIPGHYQVEDIPIPDHKQGLRHITKLLTEAEGGILANPDALEAVGHRVVHGGSSFAGPTPINKKVLRTIERHSSLAPLHNPANVLGIKTATSVFKKARQIAVFDTAFHQTIPKKAHTYAIPKSMTEKHAIRAYGFHGTSHKYVSEIASKHLNKPEGKLISIHLGNGCSMTAIQNGKSIDHSLGFGPSNGLIMGTRSGDIDQSVVFFLMDAFGHSSKYVQTMLQKKSGLLGLTGYSDMRDIQKGAELGKEDCQLALAMTAYRIKKYIGSYAVAMNGLDALIFTAGIGENSSHLRELVCADMEVLGISLDRDKNRKAGPAFPVSEIQSEQGKVNILVIPTNEELEIAKQCYHLMRED